MADMDLFGVGGRILSGLFLVPYFAWGIYTLRLRYRYHEEMRPAIEVSTLFVVALFLAIELVLLRVYVSEMPVFYIFAILGLFVSSSALYGPMVISLVSQLMVDAIMPGDRSKTREPQFGPAEALERMGDYEGALREYLVIARIFPKESAVFVRIGDMHAKLSHPEDAVQWFERALKSMSSPEKSLQIVNRTFSIYRRDLGKPGEGARVLEEFLARFPSGECADSVRERLSNIKESAATADRGQ